MRSRPAQQKNRMSREVCVEEEKAQSWTREATINFAPCSGLRSGSVWVWVWVWGKERKCSGWITRRPTCRFGPARPHAANQTESAPSPPAPTGSGLAAIEDSVPLLHRPDWAGRCRPTGTWARAGEGGTAEQCAVETVEREKNKSRAGRHGFGLALAEVDASRFREVCSRGRAANCKPARPGRICSCLCVRAKLQKENLKNDRFDPNSTTQFDHHHTPSLHHLARREYLHLTDAMHQYRTPKPEWTTAEGWPKKPSCRGPVGYQVHETACCSLPAGCRLARQSI